MRDSIVTRIALIVGLLLLLTAPAHAWLGSNLKEKLEQIAINNGYTPGEPVAIDETGTNEETGTTWGARFRNPAASTTVSSEAVNKRFEEYARQVLGASIDASDGKRGMVFLFAGVSSMYSGFVAVGATSFKANVTAASGAQGIGNMAVAGAVGGVEGEGGAAAAGIMTCYQLVAPSGMPQSTEEANALFDEVLGASARYGASFTKFRYGWYIKARYSQPVEFEDPHMAGTQACSVKILIVPDPNDTSRILVVHLTGLGSAASYVY